MTVLEVAQWSILVIFAALIFINTKTLYIAYTQKKRIFFDSTVGVTFVWIKGFSMLSFAIGIMYSYLQVKWILDGHGEEIGSLVDLMWLVEEYLVAFALLFASLFFRSILDCRHRYHRRRVDMVIREERQGAILYGRRKDDYERNV